VFDDLLLDFRPHAATSTHLLFASMWLVYLPFSHAFQLFFRYYHFLRWDDVLNLKGSNVERRVKKLLKRPINWAAPHIGLGKTWEEVIKDISDSPK
jgi:hypothetical protein